MSLPADLDDGLFVPSVPRPTEQPLNPVALLYKFWRNPLEVWSNSEFRERRCSFGFLRKRATLLNDPQDIHTCFVRNGSKLIHADIRQRVAQPLLQEGVLVAEGKAWRDGRKMIGHGFTAEQTEAAARRMYEALSGSGLLEIAPGTELKLNDFTDDLTLRMLSQVMFSGDLDDRIGDILRSAESYFDAFGRVGPLDLLRVPAWIPRPSRLLGQKPRWELREIVRDLVEKRLSDSAGRGDMLDMMLAQAEAIGASRDQVEDNVTTLLITGHETVSLALSWTLFLLSRAPAAMERARQEVDSRDLSQTDPAIWPAALPYLHACFKEAMRLFPPGPIVVRELIDDIALDGETLRKGNLVFLNTWILHRHAALWRNPHAFMPERFMPENKASIRPYSYLPFGVGHRACLGAQYATCEALIVLALLVQRFDFEYLAGRDPRPILKITVHADNRIPMRVMLRKRSH